MATFRECAPDHVMADADFLLDVRKGSALGPHRQHHLEFLGRKGHAPCGLGIRQLLAMHRPAGIGGDIRLLRLGKLLTLFG